MFIGLECQCGKEINFEKGEIESLTMEVPMIIKCSKCHNSNYIRKHGDKLASYRVVNIESKGGMAQFNFDENPISVCKMPEIYD